jgi:hypothetical protein
MQMLVWCRAAVNVYGGVHIRERDGARLPADEAAGTLHCYCFHSYTWSTLQTTGKHVPSKHNGAMQLWRKFWVAK